MDNTVSVFDRGYLYGDGIFDTMRSYRGKIFRFMDHFERLAKNAAALGINWRMGADELKGRILTLLKKNKLKDAYIRAAVSRGKGIGTEPDKKAEPHLTIIVRPSKIYPGHFYKMGVEVITSSTRRLSPFALDGKIKSMNYLNSILAREEASRRNAFEALLVSEEGYVTEGSSSNIFIVRKNKLLTPPSFLGALEGITGKAVLEIVKRSGIDIDIAPFTSYDIYTAEECFITNTGIEIMPVRAADKRIIGNGFPGSITHGIIEKFKKEVSAI